MPVKTLLVHRGTIGRVEWDQRLQQWAVELELAEQLESDRWVTLTRAEQISGASKSALRSWYRDGRIRSRLADGPHGPQRLVAAQDVIDMAGRSPHIRRRTQRELTLEGRVAILTNRVAALEIRLDALEGTFRTPRRASEG
jgi:transposase